MASDNSALAGYQPPHVEDVSESKSQDGRAGARLVPYGSALLALENVNLQDAIIAARPTVVQSWLEDELSNVKAEDLESCRKHLNTGKQIEKISSVIFDQWKRGKRKSSTEIANQIRHYPGVIEFFIEFALDQRLYELEAPEREKHNEIERILAVERHRGNDYEILRIDKEMTRSQVFQRRRELVFLVHPDRNKDPQANECTQIINDAAKRLLESNSKSYKPPARRSEDPNTFDDMFAPGAFGSGPEDSSSSEEEEEIPEIPEEIKEVHRHVRKYIDPYFSKFEEDDAEINRKIRKANNKIKRLNSKATRPIDAYQVTEGVLHALREQQKYVIKIRKEKGTAEAEKQLGTLQQQYLKTCNARKNQWPRGWGDIIDKAVRERINEINKTEPEPNRSGDAMNGVQLDYQDDSASNGSVSTTSPSIAGDDTTQLLVRPIQPLRPGYTLLGDRILGYRPLKRYNRYEGQYVTHSVKFFVETPGSKIFKIFSGSEIGYQAALAYDRLPEREKNNVGKHLESVANGTMDPGAFEGILSVGAKESEFEMMDRLPETWVRIALAGDENPSQAKIIHRTALRGWVDNADKLIDAFYVGNGIKPPWAFTPFPDPRNAVRYMALQYPAPRRRALEARDRPRLAMRPHSNEARPIGYHEAAGMSRPAVQPYQDEPGLTMTDAHGDKLLRALDQLAIMVNEQREEQREHRKLLESALQHRLTEG